jgi:hypothetical protein
MARTVRRNQIRAVGVLLDTGSMVELPGDKHLKDDERWVRHLLEGTVGQTRVIDRRGGRDVGKHDLEADLPGGGIAAIEITSEADPARLSVNAAAQRHLSNFKVPGSQFAWLVNVTTQADARALSKSTGLVALLADMEQQGHTSASALSDYRDPWRDPLEAFGIQFVHGVEGSDHPGTVYVMPAIVASWGWVRPTADKWITDFLATELGKNKIDKLARADADERHLAVLIHPDTEAGSGIAVTDELPSVVPPAPLTHLWLIAPTDPPRALRWAHISGWAVVRLPVGQRQAV